MEATGAAQFLAGLVTQFAGHSSPIWILSGFFALTVLLTQPMGDQAATVVILPVAIRTAWQLGLNPRSFAMMIALAASCSLLTPLEPACLLVYGPGHYRFTDYTQSRHRAGRVDLCHCHRDGSAALAFVTIHLARSQQPFVGRGWALEQYKTRPHSEIDPALGHLPIQVSLCIMGCTKASKQSDMPFHHPNLPRSSQGDDHPHRHSHRHAGPRNRARRRRLRSTDPSARIRELAVVLLADARRRRPTKAGPAGERSTGRLGILISSIGVFGNPLEGTPIDLESLRKGGRTPSIAPVSGADMVCGFTGRLRGQSIDASLPRYVEVFGDLARRAADQGVRLAFENCPDMGGDWKSGDWNIAHNPAAWERMFDALPLATTSGWSGSPATR